MAVIGIGTEIIECVRIAKMIETHGEQFLNRVYTQGEIDHCMGRPNAMQQFSTRWVAKESVMKAIRCHHQGVRWSEIEVVIRPGDGPAIELSGVAAIWAEQMEVDQILISLGACRTHATAYAIALDVNG